MPAQASGTHLIHVGLMVSEALSGGRCYLLKNTKRKAKLNKKLLGYDFSIKSLRIDPVSVLGPGFSIIHIVIQPLPSPIPRTFSLFQMKLCNR